jgi:hypothetical protein
MSPFISNDPVNILAATYIRQQQKNCRFYATDGKHLPRKDVTTIESPLLQRYAPRLVARQLCFKHVMSPRWGLTPRLADWLIVSRNMTLTLTCLKLEPLTRTSSIYRQTRPHVREGAPQKQDRNCQTVINIWSWAPDGAQHQDLLTDWPSVAVWLWLAWS